MREILPTSTPAWSPLHNVLYRAHVLMITHGAVLCGDTPQCDECPLRGDCEYGSLLQGRGDAAWAAAAAAVDSEAGMSGETRSNCTRRPCCA